MSAKESDFGSELRSLRRKNKRGITLAAVADQLNCSIALVSAIERGQRNPLTDDNIIKLLQFYGETSETERMLKLASVARNSVEFSLQDVDEKAASVLFALARRKDEGKLKDGDPVVDEIAKLLDEEK